MINNNLMASHSQDVNALLRRRCLTVIPKDQLKLLDRDDSWAVDLANRPHGLANVPGHVLETVKEAYIASQCPRNNGSVDRPSVDRNYGYLQSPVQEKNLNSDSPPPSSPPTEVSWEETPPRPVPQRSPAQELPANDEMSNDTAEAPLRSKSLDPGTATPPQRLSKQKHDDGSPSIRRSSRQKAMAPPPRPSPALQLAPQFGFASSDNEEEAPEVPRSRGPPKQTPVAKDIAALQRSSGTSNAPRGQAMNTPPCAQPSQSIVPETVLKANSPVKEATVPARNRRYRIKPAKFSDDSPEATKPRRALEPVKPYASIESSNSMPSSIVPSTMPEQPTQKSTGSQSAGGEKPDPPLDKNIPTEIRQSEPTKSVEVETPPIAQPIINQEDYSAQPTSPNIISHSPTPFATEKMLQEPAPNTVQTSRLTGGGVDILGNGFLDPYNTFVYFYPEYIASYSGNHDKFIKACVCLEYLQRERGLKEFLYDDFIRAFSHAFLTYVRNAGPGQEPLPAVEWYNIQPGRPIFTNMVVRKMNLERILKEYPDQVAQARAVVATDVESTEMASTNVSLVHTSGDVMDIDSAAQDSPTHSPTPVRPPPSSRPSPSLSTPGSPQHELASSAPPSDLSTPAASLGRRRTSRYLEKLTSSARSKSKKRAEDHSARWKKHLRQRLSSGAMGLSSSGRVDSTPQQEE